MSIAWSLLGLLSLVTPHPPGGYDLLPWEYLALAALGASVSFLQTVSSVEVDAQDLRVHYGYRTRPIPMAEIVRVDAYRRWLRWPSRHWAEDYEVRLRLANGRLWVMRHLLPPAGERVLARLYGLQKPITVYTWP